MNNKELGKLGEDMAERFLKSKGYKIVERNFQNRYGEVDLICKNGEIAVFVEVKTRIESNFGLPEDAINAGKIKKLIKNANAYAMIKKMKNYRIDAVCIVLDEQFGAKSINHYENITI